MKKQNPKMLAIYALIAVSIIALVYYAYPSQTGGTTPAGNIVEPPISVAVTVIDTSTQITKTATLQTTNGRDTIIAGGCHIQVYQNGFATLTYTPTSETATFHFPVSSYKINDRVPCEMTIAKQTGIA